MSREKLLRWLRLMTQRQLCGVLWACLLAHALVAAGLCSMTYFYNFGGVVTGVSIQGLALYVYFRIFRFIARQARQSGSS